MNLYSGHPAEIKKALINFIKTKKQNPLDKVLIVLPANRLESAIKQELSQTLGHISAVYFTNFTRLAVDINAASSAPYKPLLPNTILQDFIIKNILNQYGLNNTRGYAGALKAAFRDLIGALVTPKDLLSIKDELEDEGQKEYLAQITLLYHEYLQNSKNPEYYTYAELFKLAEQNTPASLWLRDFKQIIFYGFYDFTGIQFELFKTIKDNFQINLFFPYEELPAYKFAQTFYEANILGAAKTTHKLESIQNPLSLLAAGIFSLDANIVQNADIRITSVSGTTAEIESAAKEILILREQQGIAFKDIALTARSMEPYKNDILNILAMNKIPSETSLETSLTEEPLGAFFFNLFSLAKNNFYRDDVNAVITSPYFKDRDPAWVQIIKSIGVSSGYQQWLDLLPLSSDKEAAGKLAAFLESMKLILSKLEQPAHFEDICATALEVVKRYTETKDFTPAEQNILSSVNSVIAQIKTFKTVRTQAQSGEFLEEFIAALKEQTVSKVSAEKGVSVADLMSLRGQDFKAIIIMGLNESILPATPQPDPVLKDSYRKLLGKLGWLIHKQSDRYEEEKILFYFTLSAALKAVRLIYQRSGEDGKPKIPSLYLNRILNLLGMDLSNNDISVISRRPAEKYKQWQQLLLNKNEMALLAATAAQDKPAVLAAIMEQDDIEDKIKSASALNSANTLTPYDGILTEDNAIEQEIKMRGISPSDLQNLYKCPARYLFDRITDREEEVTFERTEISPLKKGTLYHEILENFYKYIKQNNMFDKLFSNGAKNLLNDFLPQYLAKENYKKYGLYPIVWQIICLNMAEHLGNFVTEDIKIMQETGFYPYLFEDKQITEITIGNKPLKLRGKLDRIDISQDGKSYKIIDYKTKKESSEITKAIFSKAVLQPPLYFEMAKTKPELKAKTPVNMALMAIEAAKPAKDLPYDTYLALKPRFEDMMEFLTDLAREGIFIISPSDNACNNCRFDAACRKAHYPTLRRAAASAQAKKLKEYHAA